MSALVRKEIRLVLPYWGIAMALVILVSLTMLGRAYQPFDSLLPAAFGFGIMLLGLAPFGYEFSAGTFSSLMVQPIERERIWKLKILVSGVAALLVLATCELILYSSMSLHYEDWYQNFYARSSHLNVMKLVTEQRDLFWSQFWQASRGMVLVFCVAMTGGFWTTLLFRQTGAALWFVILVPGAISVALIPVSYFFHAAAGEVIGLAAFAFYSVGGFLWAKRMFWRAQDYQWMGESVGAVSLTFGKAKTEAEPVRRKKVTRALLRKEIQSHQISFIIAFGVLVLHVSTLIFRKYYTMPIQSELRFAVEAVPLMWLLIPWLMGCVAIAEERKLGTMESQLCLPVRRRWQFGMKLLVVVVLGTLIGGLVPCLLEVAASHAGISSEVIPSFSMPDRGTYFATGLEMLVGACLIGVVSVFASSLTRNTLHALGAAVVFGVAWVFVFQWLLQHISRYNQYALWKGPLIVVASSVLALIATLALSFANYKRLHLGRGVWLRTVLILTGTVVAGGFATAVVYQRPWELFMSMETQHGAPVLTGPVRPAVVMPGGRICALLPDGRIWVSTDHRAQAWGEEHGPSRDGSELSGVAFAPRSGIFVGSNWVAIAAGYQQHLEALRSDGTLWSILAYESTGNGRFSLSDWLTLAPNPHQIGSDSDWKTVVSLGYSFMGVKSNGTLWTWSDYAAGLSRGLPTRVGSDSDWDKVFPLEWGMPVLIKRDGSVWTRSVVQGKWAESQFTRRQLRGGDWMDMSGANNYGLVIKQDGSLWNWGYGGFRPFGEQAWHEEGDYAEIDRLGRDSDWTAIAGFPWNLVAVKGGRILRSGKVPFAQSLGRLSRYSDWLTVDAREDRTIALAADGTICMWGDVSQSRETGEWLARSRRPIFEMNILTSAKK